MKRAAIMLALIVAAIARAYIHDIDAELDRQESACKAPAVVVRRASAARRILAGWLSAARSAHSGMRSLVPTLSLFGSSPMTSRLAS